MSAAQDEIKFAYWVPNVSGGLGGLSVRDTIASGLAASSIFESGRLVSASHPFHEGKKMLSSKVERPAFEARRPFLTEAMRRVAGPVSVVTAGIGDDRTGATVTTAQSLSIEPETMMVAINLGSSTFPVITGHNHYCVNVLRAGQDDVADRFAGRGGLKGAARYEGADWTALETGALALDGALASIDCAVEDVILRHSHALILGRVVAIALGELGPGLVYRDGRYGTVGV